MTCGQSNPHLFKWDVADMLLQVHQFERYFSSALLSLPSFLAVTKVNEVYPAYPVYHENQVT
jgi:hypothetical protein